VAVDPFGGPRSTWGGRLARAVHAAVRAGAELDRVRRAAGPPSEHRVALPGCRRPDVIGGPAGT
jgi:hypothetical protein